MGENSKSAYSHGKISAVVGFGLFGHTCVFIHILPALADVLSYPLQIQHADPIQNFPCNFGK